MKHRFGAFGFRLYLEWTFGGGAFVEFFFIFSFKQSAALEIIGWKQKLPLQMLDLQW